MSDSVLYVSVYPENALAVDERCRLGEMGWYAAGKMYPAGCIEDGVITYSVVGRIASGVFDSDSQEDISSELPGADEKEAPEVSTDAIHVIAEAMVRVTLEFNLAQYQLAKALLVS